MYTLTIVIMVQKVSEIFMMQDPSIQNFSRPMSDLDREAIAPVNFEDHHFVFGLQVVGLDLVTEEV